MDEKINILPVSGGGQDATTAMAMMNNNPWMYLVMLALFGNGAFGNNGAAAGQSDFHLHVQVVPRFDGDGILPVWPQGSYEEGEAAELAAKISANL